MRQYHLTYSIFRKAHCIFGDPQRFSEIHGFFTLDPDFFQIRVFLSNQGSHRNNWQNRKIWNGKDSQFVNCLQRINSGEYLLLHVCLSWNLGIFVAGRGSSLFTIFWCKLSFDFVPVFSIFNHFSSVDSVLIWIFHNPWKTDFLYH